MTVEPSVSVLVVRGLLDAVGEVNAVSRALALDALPLEDPTARISLAELFRVISLVLEYSGEPALGLSWIERQMERSFGSLAHMLMYAATLREAFALLAQFERIVYDGPASAWTLVEDTHSFSVRQSAWLVPDSRARAFASESLLTGMLKLVRVYFADAWPLHARFEYAAPGHSPSYERIFGPVVEFGQLWSELVFPRELLDAPSPHADSEMYTAQRRIAERRLVQVAQSASAALRVREQLLQCFPERPTMATVARALGMSERTLRSTLGAEGVSYREVEGEAYGALARDLLQDPTS